MKCSLRRLIGSILATCDFYAVEKYVQTPDRLAMRAVEPMQQCSEKSWRNRKNGKKRFGQSVKPMKI